MTAPDSVTTDIAAVSEALRTSRLAWGIHADRWADREWQAAFWTEAAQIAVTTLAERGGEVGALAEECMSRGPRIGEDVPYCKRTKGHEGRHEPGPDDGWDLSRDYWTDPPPAPAQQPPDPLAERVLALAWREGHLDVCNDCCCDMARVNPYMRGETDAQTDHHD